MQTRGSKVLTLSQRVTQSLVIDCRKDQFIENKDKAKILNKVCSFVLQRKRDVERFQIAKNLEGCTKGCALNGISY